MGHPVPRPAQQFTYGQYRTWDDDQRWELHQGQPVLMSPAPTTRHQTVVLRLSAAIEIALRGRRCRPFVAPTDVLLADDDDQDQDDITTVVQPDVFVVRDPNKIHHAYVRGAPDLVIEVLSPSTARRDQGSKRDLDEKAGVAELWLVFPDFKTVERYRHDGARYGKSEPFSVDDDLASTAVAELTVPLGSVFAES